MKHSYRLIRYVFGLLAAVMYFIPAAFAQQEMMSVKEMRSVKEMTLMKEMTSKTGMFNPLAEYPAFSGQKTAATGSRLITSTLYLGNTAASAFLPYDSTQTFYMSLTSAMIDYYITFHYASGVWTPWFKYIDSYDAQGRYSGYESLNWNAANSTYDPYSKRTFLRNAAGYVIDDLLQIWSTAAGAYVNSSHTTTTLDAANNPVLRVTRTWNAATGAWENSYYNTLTYNAQSSLTGYAYQAWDVSSGAWVNYIKTDFTYDASGLHYTLMVNAEWNTATGSWENTGRMVYTLDGAGKATTVLQDIYNTATSIWDPYYRSTYTYRSDGLVTTVINEAWDDSSSAYININMVKKEYNSFGQTTESVSYVWLSGTWGIGDGGNIQRYYYEAFTTPVAPLSQRTPAISLSPNPAINSLGISVQWDVPQDFTATLMDVQGRVHQQFRGTNAREISRKISLDGMSAGNYLFSVKCSNGDRITRMITVSH